MITYTVVAHFVGHSLFLQIQVNRKHLVDLKAVGMLLGKAIEALSSSKPQSDIAAQLLQIVEILLCKEDAILQPEDALSYTDSLIECLSSSAVRANPRIRTTITHILPPIVCPHEKYVPAKRVTN